MVRAMSALSSIRSTRRPGVRALWAGAAPASGSGGGARRSSGSGDGEPRAAPGSLALGAHRAPVLLDQRLDQREAEADPAAAAIQAAVGLGEDVEDVREDLRVHPDARVLHDEGRLARAGQRRSATWMRPPGSVNLPALFSRLPMTWESRVTSPTIGAGSAGRSKSTVRLRAVSAGRASSTTVRTRATRSIRSSWSRILPREIRATSRRSSIIRTM